MSNFLNALAAAAALGLTVPAQSAEPAKPLATIYKNPQCTCCEQYGAYLRQNGYAVKLVASHDLVDIKQRQGIPANLEGCHTTLVGGYFVEGHVPVGPMNRLLKERPAIKGISLPGMPTGSPGMGGPKREPFKIYALAPGGKRSVYAVE